MVKSNSATAYTKTHFYVKLLKAAGLWLYKHRFLLTLLQRELSTSVMFSHILVGLHNLSFQHRYRDVIIRSSHIVSIRNVESGL